MYSTTASQLKHNCLTILNLISYAHHHPVSYLLRRLASTVNPVKPISACLLMFSFLFHWPGISLSVFVSVRGEYSILLHIHIYKAL